jgi:hypothetical protein
LVIEGESKFFGNTEFNTETGAKIFRNEGDKLYFNTPFGTFPNYDTGITGQAYVSPNGTFAISMGGTGDSDVITRGIVFSTPIEFATKTGTIYPQDYAKYSSTGTGTSYASLSNRGPFTMPNSAFSGTNLVSFEDKGGVIGSIPFRAFYSTPVLNDVLFASATSIGVESFRNSKVKSASFPDVTTIGGTAFAFAVSLISIEFPSATSLGLNAFNNCTSLTEISLPNITSIGNTTFTGGTSLTEVIAPNVTSVGAFSFSSCPLLTDFVATGLTAIGEQAFVGAGITSANYPLVSTLPSGAFSACPNLSSVNMPNVTVIPEFCFSTCTSLTSVLGLGAITSVGNSAFSLSGITTFDFTNCTFVEENAFTQTPLVDISTTLNLPLLTEIRPYSFLSYNSSLTTINAPECTAIGDLAFFSDFSTVQDNGTITVKTGCTWGFVDDFFSVTLDTFLTNKGWTINYV